jgi:hypothetical protein
LRPPAFFSYVQAAARNSIKSEPAVRRCQEALQARQARESVHGWPGAHSHKFAMNDGTPIPEIKI